MKVFILEDDLMRMKLFRQWLVELDPKVEIHTTDTIKGLGSFVPPYDLILLDHDLGGRQMVAHEDNGLRFAQLIKPLINRQALIIVHSYNPDGARAMQAELDGCGSDIIHYIPFGEKLHAVIRELKK